MQLTQVINKIFQTQSEESFQKLGRIIFEKIKAQDPKLAFQFMSAYKEQDTDLLSKYPELESAIYRAYQEFVQGLEVERESKPAHFPE